MEELSNQISYAKPVDEEQFLAHLNKVCSSKYVRSLILSYYKRLKKFDVRHGKQVSAMAFGPMPFSFDDRMTLTDQAKLLFQPSPSTLLADQASMLAHRTATIANGLMGKISKLKKTQSTIQVKLDAARKNQVERLFSSLKPVGLADVFRWQFCNLVNQVVINPADNKRTAGQIDCFDKVLILGNIVDLSTIKQPEEKEYLYWQNRVVLFHELTHIMCVKLAHKGHVASLIPQKCFFENGFSVSLNPKFASNSLEEKNFSKFDEKVMNIYDSGLIMLNEIATDLCAGRFLTKDTRGHSAYYYEQFKNTPYWQSVTAGRHSKTQGLIIAASAYQGLATPIETLIALMGEGQAFCNQPKHLPTMPLLNSIEQTLRDAEWSSDITRELNSVLHKDVGLKPCVLEQDGLNFEKFVLLLGLSANRLRQTLDNKKIRKETGEQDSRYDNLSQLAQALVLDAFGNFFTGYVDKNFHKLQQKGGQKIIHQFLAETKQKLLNADEWVIKPSIKVCKPNKKAAWLADTASNFEVAQLAPNNLAVQTWNKLLQNYIKKCQTFAPEIIEKSRFLTKENNNFLKFQEQQKENKNNSPKNNFEK